MAQAVGLFTAVLLTFQFVVGSGVAAGGSDSAIKTARTIRAVVTSLALAALLIGWSTLFCISPSRLEKDRKRTTVWDHLFELLVGNSLASLAVLKLIGGVLYFVVLQWVFASDTAGFSLGALLGVLLLNGLFLSGPVELQQAQASHELGEAFASAQLTIHATRYRILPGIQAALRHLPVQPAQMEDVATALAVAESRVVAANTIASAAQLGVMRASATVHQHVGAPISTSLGQLVDGMLLGVVQDWSHDGVDVFVDCTSLRKAWGVEVGVQAYPFLQVVNEAINRAGTDILIYAEERPPILNATVSARKSADPEYPVTLFVSIVQHIRALSDVDIDELQTALGARTSTDQRWSHLALASASLRDAGGAVRIVGTRCDDLYDNGWYCVVASVPLSNCHEQALLDCCITTDRDRVLGQPLGGEVMMHVAAGLDFCSRLAAVRSGHVAVASSAHAHAQRKRSAASIASAAQFALQSREQRGSAGQGSDRVMSAVSLLDLDSGPGSIDTYPSDRVVEISSSSRAASGELQTFMAIVESEAGEDTDAEEEKLQPSKQAFIRLPPSNSTQLPVSKAGSGRAAGSPRGPVRAWQSSTSQHTTAVGRNAVVAVNANLHTTQPSTALDEDIVLSELKSRTRSGQASRSGEWSLQSADTRRGIFGSGSGGSLLRRVPSIRLKVSSSETTGSFVLPTSTQLTDSASTVDSIDVAADAVVNSASQAATK